MREEGYASREFKDERLALVGSTLLHPAYDKFEDVGGILDVWQRAKARGFMEDRTRIYWQNIIRSNVRRDDRVFTEQLTNW